MSKTLFHQSLPIFETGVKAGFPSPAEEELCAPLNLNEHLIPHPSSTFLVRVQGDSMQGAGIYSGDILVVDKSLQPAHGKIIVALLNGEFTVKRLLIGKNEIILHAENPSYPPIQVQSIHDFVVWGIVTYVIHKT